MRIAVTGGIAEGKSTVMGYLREWGYQTASADEVAREVFSTASIQAQLATALQVSGPVSPTALREQISKDAEMRRAVNRIMHPEITRRLVSSTALCIEIPLLFETALHASFDRVWVVTCGPEEQLARLTQRVGNVQVASQMIATQLPSEVKAAFADEIVRTNASEDSVKRLVGLAIEREFAK